MLKITGGIVVVAAAFMMGLHVQNDLKGKLKLLEDLMLGLKALKEEIRYLPDYLENCFLKCAAASGSAACFFEGVYNTLKTGKTLQEAWKAGMEALSGISGETTGVLDALGTQLGKTDAEGQINLLESSIAKLKLIYETQEKAYKQKGTLYPKFGAVFGVLITILLF